MMSLMRTIFGAMSLVLFTVNVVFWIIPIIVFATFKLILPFEAVTRWINHILNWCASSWISINSFMAQSHCIINVRTLDEKELSPNDWYLVIANHQSWVDIYVLQHVLNKKIPFLKFFLKQQLIFVPLLGLAWWALDFPFMQRHSKDYLKKNPHKKGKDLETTKKACEKFKHIPISVMNFVEGTRYTEAKAERQQSPYANLLKPKSGGVGTVLSILGEQMHKVVDVTIAYPEGIPTFWDFLSGRINEISVDIEVHEIDPKLVGDMDNQETRKNVQAWLNGLWATKSETIKSLQQTYQLLPSLDL